MGNDHKEVESHSTGKAADGAGASETRPLPMPRLAPRGRGASAVRDSLTLAAILAIGVAIYLGLIAGGPTWPVFTVLVAAAPLLLLALTNAGEWLLALLAHRRPAADDVSPRGASRGAHISNDEK